MVPPGSGDNAHFVVSVVGAVSEADAAFSFSYLPAPVVAALSDTAWGSPGSAGAANVTVTGSNFGVSDSNPSLQVGTTEAVSTQWVSDSSLSAEVALGVGKELPVVLHIYAQSSAVSASRFTYRLPAVTSVDPATGPAAGNFSIMVFGMHFGEENYNQTVLVDDVACLESTWLSSTAIECLAPAGYGHVEVAVDAGANTGPGLRVFEYAGAAATGICPRLVDGVDCSTLSPLRRTAGGDVLRVFGEEFGPK